MFIRKDKDFFPRVILMYLELDGHVESEKEAIRSTCMIYEAYRLYGERIGGKGKHIVCLNVEDVILT